MSLKQDLLTSAKQRAYYKLDIPELEQLWKASNDFIDKGRLQSYEFEWYTLLEQHFFLSILTCRDAVAKLMLKRIMEKFGEDSRRVWTMRAAYIQATQEPEDFTKFMGAIGEIEYDAKKLGMVELRSEGKWKEYIAALNAYLEQNPVDAEAWAELSESYATIADYDSAVQSLEQVLVIEPLAYNVFARIGELKRLQAAATISGGFSAAKDLTRSAQEYLCRAVELNPLYLRGWLGLYVVSGINLDAESEKLNTKARKVLDRLVKSNMGSPDDVAAGAKVLETAA